MIIRNANTNDVPVILQWDSIKNHELFILIQLKRIYVLEVDNQLIGWLRYNLFWDTIPFMNMLYLLETFRGQGYGKDLVTYWETQMKTLGYHTVMTSTVSNECSQHFYYKLGYQTIGGFTLNDEPYEIILSKKL